MLAVLVLAACGSSSSTVEPPVDPVTPDTALIGVVAKGRVSGARVCAYKLSDGKEGDLLGSCTNTDAEGNYTIKFRDYAGEAIVKASGGSYRDEATGTTQALTALRAVRPGEVLPLQANTVHVTPLTELAVRRALARGSLGATQLREATAEVVQRFGGFDLHDTLPLDLMAGSALLADYQERAHGFALAGFSGYIANKGVGATLDNVIDTFSRAIANNTLGNETAAFRAGIKTFMNSPQNASGFSASVSNAMVVLNFGAATNTDNSGVIAEAGEKCVVRSTQLSNIGLNAVCWFNLPANACNAAALRERTAAVLLNNAGITDTPDGYTAVASCRNHRQFYTVDALSNQVYTGDPY